MSIAPPVKPPGCSGVKVLLTTMLSIIAVGKRSSWTDFRYGSAVGTSAPLSVVLV